jgi:hypothetical protein
MSAGDAYGFAALMLVALAAVLMLLRSKLLKLTKNISLIRSIHIGVSTLAGLFLSLHIASLFLPPVSTGILLGYAAVVVSVILWLTGTAFLQKVKDSLFFHGVLSAVFVPLALMHAATASPNLSGHLSQALLGGAAIVVLANAALHIKRALSSVPR